MDAKVSTLAINYFEENLIEKVYQGPQINKDIFQRTLEKYQNKDHIKTEANLNNKIIEYFNGPTFDHLEKFSESYNQISMENIQQVLIKKNV